MKKDAKILICYNSPFSLFTVYNGKPENEDSIFIDSSETSLVNGIAKIKSLLSSHYTNVEAVALDSNIGQTIKKVNDYSPDIIFNFVESIDGIASHEFCTAGLFELLGYEFTGNQPISLGNCLNKGRAKKILNSSGIKVPKAIILSLDERDSINNFNLHYPVILKLLNEDASIGISEFSVIHNEEQLVKQVEFLFDTYKQDIIAEEYIDGREINAAVLGGKVLPLSEIIFEGLPEGLPKIVTYEGKWYEESIYYKYTKPNCPADIPKEIKIKIEETALKAYRALDCRDYARVDIRLDRNNNPYVIEVNPNPDISIDSGFARAAKASGLNYDKLLVTLAEFALNRKKYDTQTKAG
ncbi:MAG TPA: ATP-grasp domain-containing protein [Ignavibacteriaceae bacterium]|nr:ATP-grasp domain-containing protein [Ignavibacteriaceae bacterium]